MENAHFVLLYCDITFYKYAVAEDKKRLTFSNLLWPDSDPPDRQEDWQRSGDQVLHWSRGRLPSRERLRGGRSRNLRRHRLQGQQPLQHVLHEQAEGKCRLPRRDLLQAKLQKIRTPAPIR